MAGDGSMTEMDFFETVSTAGGSAFLVGGAVRDRLMGRESNDRDYVVCGLTLERFRALFPEALVVGRSFPVFLLDVGGERCEIAFARTEKKSGSGYRGFEIYSSPEIKIEQDLYRRDTTINAMALDSGGQLIDPFGGAGDIKRKIIRAVSEHFREDPVRSLRAARQAAQFGFEIDGATAAMMKETEGELIEEPKERKFGELEKALNCAKPSIYFRSLLKAGLLASLFPWIYALIGRRQPPEYHPEGDAFEHTMLVLDHSAGLSKRAEVRFAALMHDVGKGDTPDWMLPHHYGHEERGLKIIKIICATLAVPKKWRECAEFAIAEHMRAPRLKNAAKIRDLLISVEKSSLRSDGLIAVIKADGCDELPSYLADYDGCMNAMKEVHSQLIPPDLSGPEVGKWIRCREIESLRKYFATACTY